MYNFIPTDEAWEWLASPLETVFRESKVSRVKAGITTYFRRICFPKGIYYWKGVGMNSNLFGEKKDFEWYTIYVKTVDTLQGCYTLCLMIQQSLWDVIAYRYEKLAKDAEKKKK